MSEEELPPNMLRRAGGMLYTRVMRKGRPIWRSTGERDLKRAIRRHHEIMVEVNDGKQGWAQRAIPTFDQWWTRYVEAYHPLKSPSTRELEHIMFKKALPFFNRRGLDEVPKSLCVKYLNTRGKLVSQDTLNRERAFLQMLWQKAIDDGYELENPWRRIPRVPYSVRNRVVTQDEQARLLKGAPEVFRRWFLFMLGTGLRESECRSITGTDFNWEASTVRVTGKGFRGKPQVRDVPLLSLVPDLARAQLEADPAFFGGSRVKWRRMLAERCRRAKIAPVLKPHNLRHTFGTRYLQAGGDIYILSKILGHHGVSVTERTYVHLLKEDLVARSKGLNLGLDSKVVPFRRVVAEPVAARGNRRKS